MNANALLRQLEAYVQEEIGAQARLLALLEAQEQVMRAGDTAGVAANAAALEAEVAAIPARSARRSELLSALAREWHVAPTELTLARVVERAGGDGTRLARQREDLRRTAAGVTQKARTAAAAARFHRDLASGVVRALIEPESSAATATAGVLVDASA